MIIIATCPQWCRSKIKWDAERTQSAGWRCVLRAKTVHCRCSLRSLFCIKTGVEWNNTSLLVLFAFCEDKMDTDWRSENDVCWGLTNISLSIILSNHSFQIFLRYGWMDKLFINPIWEIAVSEKSQPLFSIPKQTCKMKSENDHALAHYFLCLLNTGERKLAGFCNAKPIAFLLIWPPTACGTLLHWVDSQKHHTSTMTAAYNTHTHTRTRLRLGEISAQVEYDNTRELRKTQQKVTHPSNVIWKALFFSCALHPTRASSWN